MSQQIKKFKFSRFYYLYADQLLEQFNRYGINGVLKPKSSDLGGSVLLNQEGLPSVDKLDFQSEYNPHENVMGPYPTEDFDFSLTGAYSTYNWEIFYHNPMLVAERLSQNQKFEEAREWYHYIFDPTESDGTAPNRFWRLKPFIEFLNSNKATRIQAALSADPNSTEGISVNEQISIWQENPFQPHLLAQMRVVSYMKHTIMKYLDNLIAWGDHLFRQDTMESINEATQIYLLAASILGERPQKISRKDVTELSYDDLDSGGGFDDFSNKMVQLENGIAGTTIKRDTGVQANNRGITSISVLYFCIPNNQKLLDYWDTVADRLFKIRNCQNLDGVERQLPLFAPPIDPLALVKAAGSGGSYLEAIQNLNAPLPAYRFKYMIQRAIEICNETKSLGGALLSALEKKDAEVIAGIRNQHEVGVLDNLRKAKQLAVEEANQTIETLVKSKDNVVYRQSFYRNRQYKNTEEEKQLRKMKRAYDLEAGASAVELLLGALDALPQVSAGVNGAFGSPHFAVEVGGKNYSAVASGVLKFTRALASLERAKASRLGIKASHKRRKEDWDFQAETARLELEQIDKQIEGAYHRREIALYEMELNEKQLLNAKEVADVMETKFTNKELYSWMINELSSLYFKSYQLALDVAKVAERCYQFERFDDTATFIDNLNWNSMKKGLLAGERLSNNLRQMQQSFDQTDERKFELKKNISLLSLSPASLLALKETGSCTFDIPEVLFDLDFPGHYRRRIKSVFISIPCVVGPNGNVPAKLTLGTNRVRYTTQKANKEEYGREPSDDRFKIGRPTAQAIATSTANRDAGLFELNFNDQRYLPFEGAGVISTWTLDLPKPDLAQFDYDTISDVIVHLNYEAEEGGFGSAVTDYLRENTNQLMTKDRNLRDWSQLISLKEQFVSAFTSLLNNNTTDLHIEKNHFPFLMRDRTINVQSIQLKIVPKQGVDWSARSGQNSPTNPTFQFNDDTDSPIDSDHFTLKDGVLEGRISGSPISLNINKMTLAKTEGSIVLDANEVEDIFIFIEYQLTELPIPSES